MFLRLVMSPDQDSAAGQTVAVLSIRPPAQLLLMTVASLHHTQQEVALHRRLLQALYHLSALHRQQAVTARVLLLQIVSEEIQGVPGLVYADLPLLKDAREMIMTVLHPFL